MCIEINLNLEFNKKKDEKSAKNWRLVVEVLKTTKMSKRIDRKNNESETLE